jgi:hypothetical protein
MASKLGKPGCELHRPSDRGSTLVVQAEGCGGKQHEQVLREIK